MRQSFGTMLRQLPNRTEVAELLVDVSQTGLASGLEFDLFKPRFHEFGSFVSGVASLPRIVTVHDIHIERGTQNAGDGATPPSEATESLVMELTAKTYRYLEEDGSK